MGSSVTTVIQTRDLAQIIAGNSQDSFSRIEGLAYYCGGNECLQQEMLVVDEVKVPLAVVTGRDYRCRDRVQILVDGNREEKILVV